MNNKIKERIIDELANGSFVSGELIGSQLGVSRAAIAKHIKSLIQMGLEIYSVTGKGYKLSKPLTLLDQQLINQQLRMRDINSKVEVHSVIDSTNSYLMRSLPDKLTQGQVCIAEYQSAGRGRRGRQWISPFGSHVYLSMYWYLEQGMSAAMGLNVVAAMAISDAIHDLYNIKVQLKWPNDIYLQGVKLAGILIDLEGQALEPCHSVIGIGLNLAMPEQSAEQVDQPWTDLQTQTEKVIDRNALVIKIIESLKIRLLEHQEKGITDMVEQWRLQDHFYNKAVKLVTGAKETFGICKGINNQGALLLEIDDQIKPVYGGEVSLRAAQ